MPPVAATSAHGAKMGQAFAGHEEPRLTDLLSDDVMRAVLQDDPIRVDALRELIAEVRSGLLAAVAR